MGCLTMALARSSWTGPEENFACRSRTHELYFLVNSQRCLPDLWSGNWGRHNDMQAICLSFFHADRRQGTTSDGAASRASGKMPSKHRSQQEPQ